MTEQGREAGAAAVAAAANERVFLVVVDSSPEMHVALRYACRRAQRTNGRVALLYIMEPGDFEHWMAVAEKMREEKRAEAEEVLNRLAIPVNQIVGKMPVLYLREGKPAEVIRQVIEEEPNIAILVLGASPDTGGPGPLVTAIAGKLSGKFPIPITVIPGNLSIEQLDALS